MTGEVHTDPQELLKLGIRFEAHAHELGRHLATFEGRTGTAVPASYAGLSEDVSLAIARLRERLDEIGDGMRETVRNTRAADDEAAGTIRGIH